MWEGGLQHKPDYDTYYMTLCVVISQRSIDPHTAHGAVLVSSDNRILATGYNGPIKGSDDSQVPTVSPDKYKHLIHAEENCVIGYFGSAVDLIDSTIYITGYPCSRCFAMMKQKGIRRIVYGGLISAQVEGDDSECRALSEMRNYTSNIEIRQYSGLDKVKALLDRSSSYVDYKLNEKETKDANI